MRSIKSTSVATASLFLLPLAVLACDDPLPPDTDHADHVDVGGYHVEFATMPDHIHEGDAAMIRFTVLDEGEETDSPVTSLSPEIHVIEADASEATYEGDDVSQPEDGVYTADHTFGSVGEAMVGLHFTASGGGEAEAEFTLEISEAHDE